jgi:hypothetical protein
VKRVAGVLSHSSRGSRQAVAVKRWLIAHEPGLVDETCLDRDPHTGIRPGQRRVVLAALLRGGVSLMCMSVLWF